MELDNNINYLEKEKCTGCRMCENICPKNAIIMIENKEGFLEPQIDKNKCIDCGLCKNQCPQLNDIRIYKSLKERKIYAAKDFNDKERMTGSSGGIFGVIAKNILSQNGVIYGCAFNENIVANHIRIDSVDKLYLLKGSKYVQSNILDTFKKAKIDLDAGIKVLYVGTPCQIAGLRNYLRKGYDNLITIDLVCHGVPSPKLFRKYINWIEKKNNGKIISYDFRNKEKNGWGCNVKYCINKNGRIEKKYINCNLDPYCKVFYQKKVFRKSCYNCKYANTNRIGDITLLDYWGIKREHKEIYDNKGISGVFVNTEIGHNIFEEIKSKIIFVESSEEKIKKDNDNLNNACVQPNSRNDIYDNIDKKDFEVYIKEDLKFVKRKKDVLKSFIPSKIKKMLK